MTLNELNKPNKYGTPATLVDSNSNIIELDSFNRYSTVAYGGNVVYLDGDRELISKAHLGTYEYSEGNLSVILYRIYILPMTAENILIHKSIGNL